MKYLESQHDFSQLRTKVSYLLCSMVFLWASGCSGSEDCDSAGSNASKEATTREFGRTKSLLILGVKDQTTDLFMLCEMPNYPIPLWPTDACLTFSRIEDLVETIKKYDTHAIAFADAKSITRGGKDYFCILSTDKIRIRTLAKENGIDLSHESFEFPDESWTPR